MRRAFTLIEILIVVLILGVLASLVIPRFIDVTGEAQRTAFVNNGRIFSAAAKRYELDYGVYPASKAGALPDGFGDYIQSNKWMAATPIGGEWEARANKGGVTSAIGIHYSKGSSDHDPATMQLIDQMADDGDLDTGAFQRFGGDHYFFIVAP
jgi:prepilin-type N-terminal cleavage/methylation domain-containing protein